MTVIGCNYRGCTAPSDINQQIVNFGVNPSRGPYNLTMGMTTNRSIFELNWSTIPINSPDAGGYEVDYRVRV